jgi:hypothetical protein
MFEAVGQNRPVLGFEKVEAEEAARIQAEQHREQTGQQQPEKRISDQGRRTQPEPSKPASG